MTTLPAEDLWGGSIMSTAATSDAVIAATVNYASLPKSVAIDDSAIIIYMHNNAISADDWFIISALTNSQGNPNSTAFTEFRQINATSATYSTYNYVDYLTSGINTGGKRFVP